jgi:protein-S-isoprenylcysteine O-methyltransferase Ste14
VTRWICAAFGGFAYLLFLATFAALMAFVAGIELPTVGLPRTIDTPTSLPLGLALAIDVALVGQFAAQHSVMARPAFKRIWTKLIPKPIERSVYVLLSSIVLIVLMAFWQGIAGVVWNAEASTLRGALWSLFVVGWLAVPVVSLMISHADLFGLRQVWFHLRGKAYEPLPFRTPFAYRYVRHPLYIGWAIAFWATPTMTAGHLLFAGTMTLYMIGATLLEECDLLAHFGERYAEYRRRVPMFVPNPLARPVEESEVVTAEARRDARNSCPEF